MNTFYCIAISLLIHSNALSTLENFLEIVPPSAPFSRWLEKTGELPPDFDAMPSQASLPDPLFPIVDGKQIPITTVEEWRKERERLLKTMHHWILGSIPPAPDNLIATVLQETTDEGGTMREAELRFGPEHKAKLWVKLLVPPGPGPFPIFMTQDNHRGWAQIALQRGYIACVYAGADSRDDTDTFVEAWPEYDWSRLMRRGWAAGRCLDYLETLPEADTAKCALAGHSRNGKTALMGAAVDERIALVISSSSGVGGSIPSRYAGEHRMAEGIENITRSFPEWFHPRWRFFAGNEHKMPFDLHHLVCLAAPRPALLSIALNDNVENAWAMQHTYLAAKKVYSLYNAAERLRILWRSGGHETWPEIIERYLDWCDLRFGRKPYEFPESFAYPWDWDGWHEKAHPAFTPEHLPERALGSPPPEDIKTILAAFLGSQPSALSVENMAYGIMKENQLAMFDRNVVAKGLERDQVVFGGYINGDIYLPEGSMKGGKKLPAILYLPSLCAPGGYNAAYKRGEEAFVTLARAGYAVFCHDPIGAGRRIDEVSRFYDRYPDWSLLGKQVQDARDALSAMEQLAYIDPKSIWVVGYESGALTAMHLCALDARPKGIALVCPPLPYRLDTDERETGGIKRWAQETMLLPQLGLFSGVESRIPYDLDELLAAQAPKPLVLVTPEYDRFAPPHRVSAYADLLALRYREANASTHLIRVSPEKYNHFDNTMQQALLKALQSAEHPNE